MSMNRLKLNSDRTQFIWLASQQQLLKVGVVNIQLGNNKDALQSNVCNLGVYPDSQLTTKTRAAYLSCVVLPAKSALIGPSLAFCPCMFSSCTCVRHQQAWLLVQPAGWNWRWSDRPASIGEDAQVWPNLSQHARPPPLASHSFKNWL
jgi:hypothetical protein